MNYGLFSRYAPLIAALPGRSPLLQSDLLTATFQLEHHPALDIYYVPFELVNAQAQVMLVGITPGWTQMEVAYRVARDGLREGLPADVVLRRVEDTASFAGPMRTNLVLMLDGIGLASLLDIPSAAALFSVRSDLIHTTSVLRFPVFVHGKNYTGSAPNLSQSPVLRPQIFGRFREEVQAASNALIIPLGDRVSEALQLLVHDRVVDEGRCLLGFPHPSPANGHRKARYAEHRDNLRSAAQAWFHSRSMATTRSVISDVNRR
jgi:hypothetical protein